MAKRRKSNRYRKLEALARRLNNWKVRLERDADTYLDMLSCPGGPRIGALFHGAVDGSGTMYLRSNPTNLDVLHELAHVLDFLKNPERWINPASTPEGGELLREQAAFNRLRNSRSWCRLNLQERRNAFEYLQNLGGDPSIDLQTGKTKNRFSF
jgi:hypothetical protein